MGDFMDALSVIGEPVLPDIIQTVRDDLQKRRFELRTIFLIELLDRLGKRQAVPVLLEVLEVDYPDKYKERDFKRPAIDALGRLVAKKQIDKKHLKDYDW